MVEQWNRQCGTVDHLMVEQGNISWWSRGRYDVRTVKQRWWNSDTFGTVDHLFVEQWNILWWNSGSSHGGTVEDMVLEQWNRDFGTVEHLMREQ